MAELISVAASVVAVAMSWRLSRSTMSSFTGVCVTIAVASITWNQIKPIAFPLSDLMLLLSAPGVIVLALRRGHPRLPVGCLYAALAIAVVTLLIAFFPVSQTYSDARYAGDTGIRYVFHLSEGTRIYEHITVGIKLQVGLLLLPLALMVVAPDRDRMRSLFDLWGFSAVLNAFVAAVDSTHVTHIGPALVVAGVDATGRQSGLTNHPNHLATVCVIAIPVVLSWWGRSPSWRRASIASFLLLTFAIYKTGSRGGLAAGAVIVVVAVMSQREVRRMVLPVAIPAALALAAVAVLDFGLIHHLLGHTRLFSSTAAGSDQQRTELARQAAQDIAHRPLLGIGYDVADQGHSIYLQAIASGGVFTLAALALYVASVVRRTGIPGPGFWRPFEIAALVGLLGWLTLGAIENDFADRYPYVSLAMLLAIASLKAAPIVHPTRAEALRELPTGELPPVPV